MLQKIPIKSLEDIALGLIKRDNETKKNYYNYHDTVKELEFEIKRVKNNKSDNKEVIKIITTSKKEKQAQTQDEITKSLKTTKTLKSTNNINTNGNNIPNPNPKSTNKRLSFKSQKNNGNKRQISSNKAKHMSKEKNIKEKEEGIILKNKKIMYNEKLFFPLDYNNINLIINDCYYPLLQCFQSYENFQVLMFEIAEKLEIKKSIRLLKILSKKKKFWN